MVVVVVAVAVVLLLKLLLPLLLLFLVVAVVVFVVVFFPSHCPYARRSLWYAMVRQAWSSRSRGLPSLPKAICAARMKAPRSPGSASAAPLRVAAHVQLVERQEHARPELSVRAGKEIALKRLVEGNLQGLQDVAV